METADKIIAILEKAKDLPDGAEKTKLLNEVKDLMQPLREEVEISERLMRIQVAHDLNIHIED